MTYSMYDADAPFIEAAIAEAGTGLAEGGIPIGSVLVIDGRIIGRGHNRRVQSGSVVLHGEMDALENAGRQTAARYSRSVLYTTLSPCAMCTGAILLYGIPKVVVGENATFTGEEQLLRDRGVEVVVLGDQRCVDLMTAFIDANPQLWNEGIGVQPRPLTMAWIQTRIRVMSRILPLSEIKAKLSEVIDEIVTTHERVTVTRNGRPVAVVLSADDLESIEETIAILSDPNAMQEIRRGREAIANGDVATKLQIEALRKQLRGQLRANTA